MTTSWSMRTAPSFNTDRCPHQLIIKHRELIVPYSVNASHFTSKIQSSKRLVEPRWPRLRECYYISNQLYQLSTQVFVSSLCDRLRHNFGFTGKALNWFKSYLTGRSQFVSFNGEQSKTTRVYYGVPQGSVLGPLFFLLYTAEVFAIVKKHGLMSHGYADDLQIYGHTDPGSTSTLVSTLSHCVDDLKDWMASNRLRLNPAKTELIWLASSRRLHRCLSDALLVSGVWIQPSKKVRNLGVIIDSDLSLASHISHVTSLCYFHIRQLRLVQRSLEQDTAETFVRSFIHSRLDYCNGVLAGQPAYVYKRLQSVLRSAARLVLKLPSHASVTVRMRDELHWLGFPHRITFKLCTLAYKCLHGQAPDYLARSCIPVSTVCGRSRLRSATVGQLLTPSIHTETLGSRGFSFSCPTAWNALPDYLK